MPDESLGHDRRSEEFSRVWKHIHIVEGDIERLEKETGGLTYVVFGVPQVPQSGLVNEIPKRMRDLEDKLETTNRALWGIIGTGVVTLAVQIVIHYTG